VPGVKLGGSVGLMLALPCASTDIEPIVVPLIEKVTLPWVTGAPPAVTVACTLTAVPVVALKAPPEAVTAVLVGVALLAWFW
jgi:hypothetical protein